jgi:uncharacterized membrane protein
MTMTKGKAFIMCFCGIMSVFMCVFLFVALRDKEPTLIPVEPCLTALVVIAGGYIGFSVANNGVKGRWWSNDFYEHENKEGEKQ